MKSFFYPLTFCFFALEISLCAQIKIGYEEIEDRAELEILNPALSKRTSTKIRLNNGLEAYLISDPGVEQSAAALSVEAGSWDDPKEYPGMAHFLEHMLFMGTQAYPEEFEYMQYISDHGGKVNAYTASDRTVYMFSVNNEGFIGALDRFSHFFIDPLFLPSSIGRELHAVDQEHAKNIENDNWRQYMIFKETGNPDHPNSKFSTGNKKTLMGIPQDAMKQWYKEHYTPAKMHLVVLSPIPLQELIQLTLQDFSKVPTNEFCKTPLNTLMTSSQQRGHMIYIKPVKDLRVLSLSWEVLTPFASDNEKKALDLVAYALGSGGPNSLEQELKKERLAESIHVAQDRFGKQEVLFNIDINLTDHGVNHLDTVINRVYQGIAQLKTKGIPYYVYEDMRKISELKYQYQSREDAFETVQKHAHQLVDESLDTYPKKTLIPSTYDPEYVLSFLSTLTPQSCVYFLIANPEKFSITHLNKEKWMGAEYAISILPPQKLNQWEEIQPIPEIDLPIKNPYLPNHLELVHNQVENPKKILPELIANDDSAKVYFSADERYQVPQLVNMFSLCSPMIDGSARSRALTDLYLKALNQQLSASLAQAETAGIQADFSSRDLALQISISGYSEKAPLLTKEIFQTLKNVKTSKEQFEIYKQSLISSYENAEKELPLLQSLEMMNSLIFNSSPTNAEKLKTLRSITYDEFVQFSARLFKKTYVKALLYGNLSLANATDLWTEIKSHFKTDAYPENEHHKKQVLVLPEKQGPYMLVQKTSMQGNAVLLLLEEGRFSFEARGIQQILGKALRDGFFDTLRTKQQTAYIAKAWDTEVERQLLQFFAVQSSTHQPAELIARFELFLENFVKQFSKKISPERFDQLRKTSIVSLEMPPENMEGMAAKLFTLAFEYEGDFDLIDKRVEQLKQLSYEQFSETAKQFLSRANTQRLAILMEGNVSKDNDFRYEIVTKEGLKNLGTYVAWK